MLRLPNWIWNLIASVLSAAAIFAAYHVFFLDQPRRGITVILEPPIPLISIEELTKQELVNQEFKIFYKDELLENTNIYTLNSKMVNSGNEPIEEEDYSESIKFVFDKADKLISVSSTSEPDGIKISLRKVSDNEAEANRVLLNQGDQIYSRFLVQSKNSMLITQALKVTARIKGINQIEKIIEKSAVESEIERIASRQMLIYIISGTLVGIFSFIFRDIIKIITRLNFNKVER